MVHGHLHVHVDVLKLYLL